MGGAGSSDKDEIERDRKRREQEMKPRRLVTRSISFRESRQVNNYVVEHIDGSSHRPGHHVQYASGSPRLLPCRYSHRKNPTMFSYATVEMISRSNQDGRNSIHHPKGSHPTEQYLCRQRD
jgi:hypothetical protein